MSGISKDYGVPPPGQFELYRQPQHPITTKLTVVRELLTSLEEAHSSKSKAKAFQASYKNIAQSLNQDPSLQRVANLARELTGRWTEKKYTELHEEATSVKGALKKKIVDLQKKAAQKKHPRDEEAPHLEERQGERIELKIRKSQPEGEPQEMVQVMPNVQFKLPSFSDMSGKMQEAARHAALGVQYVAGGATVLMTALKAVSIGGRMYSGDFGGAAAELADHRFYMLLTASGTVSKAAGVARTYIPERTLTANNDLCVDLTQEARNGKLYPAIARDAEIQSTIQRLTAKDKPNVLLVGLAGVGKTAIVEGLAMRIVRGDVPPILQNKRILSLNMGALASDTQYRGQFEKKLQEVIALAKDPNVILFIDEIHTVIRAGKAEGASGAGDQLKPALGRGEIHCIGATTIDEYNEVIAQQDAFKRRFEKVEVNEPSIDGAKQILRERKSTLEQHYKVRISEDAIDAAVVLTHKFIRDRALPDKAIDLLEAAASGVYMARNSEPLEIRQLKAIVSAQIKEFNNLKAEGGNKERRNDLKESITSNTESLKALMGQYEQDKKSLEAIQNMQDELTHIQQLRTQDRSPALKIRRDELRNAIYELRKSLVILKDSVDAKVIHDVLQEKLGRR